MVTLTDKCIQGKIAKNGELTSVFSFLLDFSFSSYYFKQAPKNIFTQFKNFFLEWGLAVMATLS